MSAVSRTAAKHSVTVEDDHNLLVRCDECSGAWSPNLGTGGRLPFRWWACPHHNCNR